MRVIRILEAVTHASRHCVQVPIRRILRPFGFDFSYSRLDDRIAMNEPPNPEVAVLAAALELPADERGAYLDQTCAGDARRFLGK